MSSPVRSGELTARGRFARLLAASPAHGPAPPRSRAWQTSNTVAHDPPDVVTPDVPPVRSPPGSLRPPSRPDAALDYARASTPADLGGGGVLRDSWLVTPGRLVARCPSVPPVCAVPARTDVDVPGGGICTPGLRTLPLMGGPSLMTHMTHQASAAILRTTMTLTSRLRRTLLGQWG